MKMRVKTEVQRETGDMSTFFTHLLHREREIENLHFLFLLHTGRKNLGSPSKSRLCLEAENLHDHRQHICRRQSINFEIVSLGSLTLPSARSACKLYHYIYVLYQLHTEQKDKGRVKDGFVPAVGGGGGIGRVRTQCG